MTTRSLFAAAAAAAGAAALAAGVATAASPVNGTIAGPVTAVQSQTFTLKTTLSPTGSSRVHVGSSTAITEQATGDRSDLRAGVCVAAFGQKDNKGVVQAARIMLSKPVKGKCGTGFRVGPPRRGPPQQGAPRRQLPQGYGPRGGFGNFGFATGGITAVAGSTLTVHNQQGTTKVTVSSKTQIVKTVTVPFSMIRVGLCTFVQGTSTDKGVNVSAQSISLFKAAGSNGCTGTFRRP